MKNPIFTKEEFIKQSPEFRIGAVISDGMWYSYTKWRKLSKVSEEELNDFIKKNLEDGTMVQAEGGAKSYRFPMKSVLSWYEKNHLNVGDQLVDFLFPARIWENLTEVEGFLNTPRREIGIVTFNCSSAIAEEVSQELRGVARIREIDPGKYKAYGLSSQFIKEKVDKVFSRHPEAEKGKIYARLVGQRRELTDFPKDFIRDMLSFYRPFAKSLVKTEMATIRIYIPNPEDQESQILMWIIDAIEKFDETAAVPFSGYLHSVLKKWPYNLPDAFLGKELSSFQKERSRAITALKNQLGVDGEVNFSSNEIAEAMDMDHYDFQSLEAKHKTWTRMTTASPMMWEDNPEEKPGIKLFSGDSTFNESDIPAAARISSAVVKAAINSQAYEEALLVISQIDENEINLEQLKSLSKDFIQELGLQLGLG